MFWQKPVIEEKKQPSALKTALLVIGILAAISAVLVVAYNFFKKHFKISFEYDCDCCGDSCEECDCEDCNDELFADCAFCSEWDDAPTSETEPEQIAENNEETQE